jgi:hypothetical protein
MNRPYLLCIILSLIVFSGCVVAFKSISANTFDGLSVGMSKEQVTKMAGEPTEKENMLIDGKEYEVWTYPIERQFAGKYNALGYLYYEILFLDNQVKHWDTLKVYSQPEYKLKHPQAPEGARTFKFFEKQS